MVERMPSYLIEAYLPAEAGLLEDAHSRARRTAELGLGVRHLQTMFVPDDETCFHLFEAPSSRALGDAARLAALDHVRIVEAIDAVGASPREEDSR